MAYLVNGVEVLRRGNLWFEEERFAVRSFLRLDVELMGACGGNGRKLLLERGAHVGVVGSGPTARILSMEKRFPGGEVDAQKQLKVDVKTRRGLAENDGQNRQPKNHSYRLTFPHVTAFFCRIGVSRRRRLGHHLRVFSLWIITRYVLAALFFNCVR